MIIVQDVQIVGGVQRVVVVQRMWRWSQVHQRMVMWMGQVVVGDGRGGRQVIATGRAVIVVIGTTAIALVLLLLCLLVGALGGRRRSLFAAPRLAPRHAVHEANLQDLARLERGAWQQDHRTGHVARLHTNHIGVLVVAKVRHFPGLVQPRIPDHRVRKVVFLQPHLPPRHYVRHDMLLRRVLVNAVRPLVDRHHIPALLVDRSVARLVDERAPVQPRYLATAHIRHLQVCVQEQVERERNVLAGIIHANVEVQLLLSQDQAVSYPKAREGRIG